MKLLLDTNVLIWWLGDLARLGPTVREAIGDVSNEVFVSPASVWEIEIKRATNKLAAPDDLLEAIEDQGFLPLPVTLRHASVAGRLPRHHNDPFDRLLIAQALEENLLLATSDSAFASYDIPLLPAGH